MREVEPLLVAKSSREMRTSRFLSLSLSLCRFKTLDILFEIIKREKLLLSLSEEGKSLAVKVDVQSQRLNFNFSSVFLGQCAADRFALKEVAAIRLRFRGEFVGRWYALLRIRRNSRRRD